MTNEKEVLEKISWRWVSINNIRHTLHPLKTGVMACGISGDGFRLIPNTRLKKCRSCLKVVTAQHGKG